MSVWIIYILAILSYFLIIDELIHFNLRFFIFAMIFNFISNVLYAYRIVLLAKSSKATFSSIFHYSVSIGLINLIFPVRLGDGLFFVKNKKSPITLRENYIYFMKIKFTELVMIAIMCCILLPSFYTYLFGILCLILVVCFLPLRFVIASLFYVAMVFSLILTFFEEVNFGTSDFVLLIINFVVPIGSFAIFAFGDVLLHYFDVAALATSVSMRLHTLLSVVSLFLIVSINANKI